MKRLLILAVMIGGLATVGSNVSEAGRVRVRSGYYGGGYYGGGYYGSPYYGGGYYRGGYGYYPYRSYYRGGWGGGWGWNRGWGNRGGVYIGW